MAIDLTRVADLIVPEIYTPYMQQATEEKTAIIQAGVLVRDAELDALLPGGGLTFNSPSFFDIDSDIEENISSDTGDKAPIHGTSATKEIQVRINRNVAFGAANLAGVLAGADPLQSIISRMQPYWSKRLQRAFNATMIGVVAANRLPTDAYHEQDDMIFDISGDAFNADTTSIRGSAVIDAALTMGDSINELSVMVMHSVVYGQLQKQNLIEYVEHSISKVRFATYMGRRIVVDDAVYNKDGVFHTWFFEPGAFRFGVGSPNRPVEYVRDGLANQGGGEDAIITRNEWIIHPKGYAYIAQGTPNGGPDNATLALGTTWRRVYEDRRMVKMAVLVTREY